MNDRREQYFWITFGNRETAAIQRDEQKNGSVLTGVGYTVRGKEMKVITNHHCCAENIDMPWLEPRYDFNPVASHHIKFVVGDGMYTLYLDGVCQFECALPQSYNGGYIGVGSGQTGTCVSNFMLSGAPFVADTCYYKPNVQTDIGYKMPPESFYEIKDNGLVRVFNGSGNFMGNVPMLYTGEKFDDFTLEFDLLFGDGFMKEPPHTEPKKDPFDTYAFGPPPLGLFVDWRGYGDIEDTFVHDDCFEIKIKKQPFEQPDSIYISCPNMGGVRISSKPPLTREEAPEENTAIFEPEYSLPINKDEFNNALVGADGTIVRLVRDGGYWGLEIYNAQGELIETINKWNLYYSDDRFLRRQYRLALPLKSDEVIFGTGERYSHFNQHGKRIRFWNTDPCYHGFSSLETHDLWRGYKNVPIVTSDRGITYFFNTTCCGEGDFGNTDKTRMQLTFDDYRMDFYIWTGTPLENIKKYTALTGRQVLPPKWAFRYMAGGSNGFWGFGRKTEEEVRELLKSAIDGYEKLGGVPAAMYFEGGGADDPECYKICAENGIKALQWNCGDYFPKKMWEIYPDRTYKEMPMAQNLINPEGVHYFGDFTHPDSHETIKKIHGEHISWGLRGGMVDFTELVPYDTKFYNGLCGNRMHNFWVYWYSKAYHDLYTDLVGDDYLCYVRGACAGSQKFNCTWTGDQKCGFDGMKQQLAGGLSLTASGFSVWGTDMCGLTGKPTSEEYVRALEFNAFIPMMRTGGDTSKLPWEYGEDVENAFKKYYWVRENIVDTLYGAAVKTHIDGDPMTQALALAYPQERSAAGNGEEYIFCDNMLVAPVLSEGADTKEVYFPSGSWYNLFSGEKISGGCSETVSAPLGTIPVYLREGTVMPVTLDRQMRISAQMGEERFAALIITPADGTRELYTYINKQTKVEFSNICGEDGTLNVTVSESGEYFGALIMAGSAAVEVNGKKLKSFGTVEEIPSSGGFATDGKFTYIRTGDEKIEGIKIFTK